MIAPSLDLIPTLADVVSINSINPAYEQGCPESELPNIERYFSRLGIETFRQPVMWGRCNVIARLPGLNPDRRVVLKAHMDAVSVIGMTIIFWIMSTSYRCCSEVRP